MQQKVFARCSGSWVVKKYTTMTFYVKLVSFLSIHDIRYNMPEGVELVNFFFLFCLSHLNKWPEVEYSLKILFVVFFVQEIAHYLYGTFTTTLKV